ncbi:MAG: alkaline phosphatase [Phycisphaeraceae bacterium]|nr:alkaline phosphatase [Phycisphaeraceae bacterium]
MQPSSLTVLKISRITCLFVMLLCVQSVHAQDRAKYVFYFIGDGMGPLQREVGQQYLVGVTGDANAKLEMDQLPVQGFLQTHSANASITDSAAAGTALACGVKTNNGVICMAPDKQTKLTTLAEHVHQAGVKVGILTSVTLDHATPACFYAHQPSRNMVFQISQELAASPFAYFAGGGLSGKSANGIDNLQVAAQNGFHITRSRQALIDAKPGQRVIAFNERMDSDRRPLPWEADRMSNDISLATFTEHAIRLLENDKGFFMMVEGGMIDWAGHGNAVRTMAHEVIALDHAIKAALDFYNKHPNDTLIVITADHETGGMQHDGHPNPTYLASQTTSYDHFKTKLKQLVEKKADFKTAYQMAQIHFGIDEQPEKNIAFLQKAWQALLDGQRIVHNHGKNNDFTEAFLKLSANAAGYRFTTHGHSAADVPISAIGVGAQHFEGNFDNTQVPRKIYQIMTGKEMP